MIIYDKSVEVIDVPGGGGVVTTSTGTGSGTPSVNLAKRITITWAHTDATPNALKGFRVAIYTGTDPNNTNNYICPPLEVGPTVTSVVKSVTVATTSTVVNSSVQALYKNGNEGSWRSSAGSVTVDPDTLGLPSAADIAKKSTVFFQNDTPIPTSLKAGDVWVDTTALHGNKMYVANGAGATAIGTSGNVWILAQDSYSAQIAVNDIQSDGVLSLSEKPVMKSRYDSAINEADIVIKRATSLGVSSSALSSALGAVTSFFTALYLGTNLYWWDCATATGTSITLPDNTTMGTIWSTFDTEMTRCIMACQSARRGINFVVWTGSTPATVDLSNPPTTTPTTIDGVSITDQAKVLLTNQSTTSQNGLYTVTVSAGSSATNYTPSASSITSGLGTYSNGGADRDANSTTYETATSKTTLSASTTIITYSGFSGPATAGVAHFVVDTSVGDGDYAARIIVDYSTDSGTTWTTFTNGNISTNIATDLTASLSGIALANLRIRATLWGDRTLEELGPPKIYSYSWSTATLRAVYFAATTTTSGTVWTKNTNVGVGETYTVIAGTKANQDATVATVSGANALTMSYAPATATTGGTVTSIVAGTGLSGGTITGSGTIAVNYGTTAGTACAGNDSRLGTAAATWGSITGASAQASPAGGWTGNHGAMSMGALTATTGGFSGAVTVSGSSNIIGSNAILQNYFIEQYPSTGWANAGVYIGSGSNWGTSHRELLLQGGSATFASSVSMGALTATSGTFSSTVQLAGNGLKVNWYSAGYENWYAGMNASSTAFVIGSGTTPTILTIGNAGAATFASSVSMGALTATSGQFGTGTRTFPLEVFATGSNAVIGLHKTDAVTADWYLHAGRLSANSFSIGDNTNYRFSIDNTGAASFQGNSVSMGALTATGASIGGTATAAQKVNIDQSTSTADGATALRVSVSAASAGSAYGVYSVTAAASGYQNIAVFASASGAVTRNYAFYGALGDFYNAGAATFASTIAATSATLSSFLALVNGQKIYYATATDTNWSTGREAAPSGAVLTTGYALVNVAWAADTQGWLWRNSSGTSLLELTGASGNMRVAGSVSMGALTATSDGGNAAVFNGGTYSYKSQVLFQSCPSDPNYYTAFLQQANAGFTITNTNFAKTTVSLNLYDGKATFSGAVSMGALTATSGTFSAGITLSASAGTNAWLILTRGTDATQIAWLSWANVGGVNKWGMGLGDAGANGFKIFNYTLSAAALTIDTASAATFGGNLTVSGGTSTVSGTGSVQQFLTNNAVGGKNWSLNSYSDGKFYLGVSGVFNAFTIDGTSQAATFGSSVSMGALAATATSGNISTFYGPNDGAGQIRMTGTGYPTYYWEMGREAAMTGDFILTESVAGTRRQRFRIASGSGVATFSDAVSTSTGNLLFDSTSTPASVSSNRWLWRNGNQLNWRGNGTTDEIIYTTGNIGTYATTVMAAVAQSLAPQWVASLPGLPNAQYPAAYWDAAAGVYQGGYVCILSTKAMYQNQGGSWVSVGSASAIFGQVTAAQISATSIGAGALVADFVLVNNILRSTGYSAGAITPSAGAPPQGFKFAGNNTGAYGPFSTPCYNGDTTTNNASGVQANKTVIMELGGAVSLNGYYVGDLALGRLVNGGVFIKTTSGSIAWVCPPGITAVDMVMTAGGGGGGGGSAANDHGAGGAGAGGSIRRTIAVSALTSYTITVGAAGAAGGSAANGGNGGDTSITGLIDGSSQTITVSGGIGGLSNGVGSAGGSSGVAASSGASNGTTGAGTARTSISGIRYVSACGGASGGGGGVYPGSANAGGACDEFSGGAGGGTNAATTGKGGGGAASPYGSGGAGGSASAGSTPAATAYGAGGGGGANSNSTGYAGGSGICGFIRLIY